VALRVCDQLVTPDLYYVPGVNTQMPLLDKLHDIEPLPGGFGIAVIGVAIFTAVSIDRQVFAEAATGVSPFAKAAIAIAEYIFTSAKQALSAVRAV